MNESEYLELYEAIKERDAAELRLARIADLCNREERMELYTPLWIDKVRAILNDRSKND